MSDRPSQREYWNSKVGEEWARQADRTDTMFAALTEATFAALALRPGERVLDIGCGAGATTLNAARQVGAQGQAVGVDISAPLLAVGRSRAEHAGARIDFVEADVSAGAVAGAPFDAAFSRFGVMFFENPVDGFAGIRSNLRPGGRMTFVCWRSPKENTWASAPIAALAPLLSAPLPPSDPTAPGPFQLADSDKIKTVLAQAGWRDMAITPWDGDFILGTDPDDAASFALRIGPSARAIADNGLDPAAAEQLIVERLRQSMTTQGVALAGACWIVTAIA